MSPGGSPRRPLRLAAALVVTSLALGPALVYGLSELELRRPREAPSVPLRLSAPPDAVEGERMARIVGCLEGCHGRRGEGGHEEVQGLLRHAAPTLSQVLPAYDEEAFVRLVRYGVKQSGESALGMPSHTFWALGDQDLANILACLRRLPEQPPVQRTLELTWRGRWSLVTGAWKVSSEAVDRSRPRWGDLPQPTAFERGRYLASVTCTECHGLDFGGNPLERAPSLAIVGAYSADQFRRLMRTAVPLGARALDPAMSWVVEAPFTEAEVNGLYLFLRRHHGFGP